MTADFRYLEGDYEARVELDRLKLHPRNPKRGDEAAIEASIDRHGFYGAVMAQRSTGHIVYGNHRLKVAKRKGATHLPVIWVDVDDDEAEEILVGDNRTAELGTNDDPILASLLSEFAARGALEAAGYTGQFLDDLLDRIGGRAGAPALTDVDDVPTAIPVDPITRPGDVWLLGSHRLVCGSCSDPAIVELATAGELVDLLFTSPPYNVGVQYTDHDDKAAPWDAYGAFLKACLEPTLAAVRPGGAIAWNIGTSPKTYPHRQAALIEDLGAAYVRTCIWQKVGVPVPDLASHDPGAVVALLHPQLRP